MYPLDKKYNDKLEELAQEVQASEELAKYLEDEEEEDYARLKELYEPRIALLYDEVASVDPLQLIAFENVLIDSVYEGLYLPKILGYSVLRGELNEYKKYARPQNHFKAVLLAICNSANFDILRKRIGQSIQMGFAMSSDIWITNLINEISNKRIRYFLQSQKLDKYRQPEARMAGLTRYKRQFRNDNYQTAAFPNSRGGLKTEVPALKTFLIHRVKSKANNASIIEPIKAFIANEEFQGTQEHLEIIALYANFFDLSEKDQEHLSNVLNKVRESMSDFDAKWLVFILSLHDNTKIDVDPRADQRVSAVLFKKIKDDLTSFYNLTDVIHTKGYINDAAQEATKVFYNQHEGLSLVNECLRQTIYQYFARLINNLEVTAYSDLFEASKIYPVYMDIFANQQFNQDIKELSMAYVHRLLKHYTDKRGKDYQDIKKFVSTTFPDLGFLKEKEVIELFKTRRKRKKEVS